MKINTMLLFFAFLSFSIKAQKNPQNKALNSYIKTTLLEKSEKQFVSYFSNRDNKEYVLNISFIIDKNGNPFETSIKMISPSMEINKILKNAILKNPHKEVLKNKYGFPVLSSYYESFKISLVDEKIDVNLLIDNEKNTNSNFIFPKYKGCPEGSNLEKKMCLQKELTLLITKKANFNKAIRKIDDKGRVHNFVQFIINKEGDFDNISYFAHNESCKKELQRIFKKFKACEPAKYKGKPVSIPFMIPVHIAIID